VWDVTLSPIHGQRRERRDFSCKYPCPDRQSLVSTRLILESSYGDRVLQLEHRSFPPYLPKKGEDYMNPKQREHFKTMLEALKIELSQDIDRTVHAMQDEATVFADPNDRASQESDIALELRNRDRERKLIKKIDETIARIDKDDYGYCEKCGVEIGLKRLEARPTATLCIDCKTLDELKEKQVAK
jgi:DnaK suppressor protein